MRSAGACVACVVLLVGAFRARAQTDVNIVLDDISVSAPGRYTMDVYLEPTHPLTFTRPLIGYDFGLLVERLTGPAGLVEFRPPDFQALSGPDFVFGEEPTDMSIATANPAPSPTEILLDVINQGTWRPLSSRLLAARIEVNVPAVPPGQALYRIRLDPSVTAVAFYVERGIDPDIGFDVGYITFPEPAALAPLGVCAMLLLRRRRDGALS